MTEKLRKIHEDIFDYIATIEDLEEQDYHLLLGGMNNLIGQIMQMEKYIQDDKKWKKEKEKIFGDKLYAEEN